MTTGGTMLAAAQRQLAEIPDTAEVAPLREAIVLIAGLIDAAQRPESEVTAPQLGQLLKLLLAAEADLRKLTSGEVKRESLAATLGKQLAEPVRTNSGRLG